MATSSGTKQYSFGFFTACLALLALFTAAPAVLNHLTAAEGAAMFGYQVCCMLLPGYALLRLLRFPCRSEIEVFGFSYAAGYCISILCYLMAIPFSHWYENWMVWIARLNYGFAFFSLFGLLLARFLGKRYQPAGGGAVRGGRSFVLFLWFGLFLLYFLGYGLPNRLPNLGSEQAYYMDTLYWIGNAISLSRGFPPENVRGAGSLLTYHFLSSMQLVSMSKATGLSLQALGLALHYIQSALLLSFGAFIFFSELTSKKRAILLSVVLLLFSMGDFSETNALITSHILTAPFGFEYGLGLYLFAMCLLVRLYRREILSGPELPLYLLFLPICMGVKAPVAVLLLAFEGLLCFRWLFDRRKRWAAVFFGLLSVALCLLVFLGIMNNLDAWLKSSGTVSRSAAAAAKPLLSWEGTSQYSTIIAQWYQPEYYSVQRLRPILAIKIVLQFIFYTNMPITFLCFWQLIVMLRRPREHSFLYWACFPVLAAALAMTLFISMEGYSQTYFIQAAAVPALMVALYGAANPVRQQKLLLFKRLVAAPLIVATVLNAALFLSHYVDDAIKTMRTGTAVMTSFTAAALQSGLVTPQEAEGYAWIRENTDPDAILITNATVMPGSPLMTNVFCERRMWVESPRATAVDRATAKYRLALINRFYCRRSSPAQQEIAADGVDFAIVLHRYETGREGVRELNCVFSNDDISVYAMNG